MDVAVCRYPKRFSMHLTTMATPSWRAGSTGLFQAPLDQLLVGLNAKLFRIGVNTEDEIDDEGRTVSKGKSLYSGRHRARDRFRQIKCSEEMSRAIMGHTR